MESYDNLELIQKYFRNELTPQERQVFNHLQQEPTFQQELAEFELLYDLLEVGAIVEEAEFLINDLKPKPIRISEKLRKLLNKEEVTYSQAELLAVLKKVGGKAEESMYLAAYEEGGFIERLKKGEEDSLKSFGDDYKDEIKKIYDAYWPMILQMVKLNHGTEDEARKLYQAAISELFEKIRNREIELNASTIKSNLYTICKNKWLGS